MTSVMVGAILLVAGVAFYILHPLLVGRKAVMVREEHEPTEAEARKRVALLSLRDVEYDYATGKLDEKDYEELRSDLAREALEALEAEKEERSDDGDPAEGRSVREAEVGGYPAARGLEELEQEIAAYRAALRRGTACPRCANPNEAGARFCAQCGETLEGAPMGAPSEVHAGGRDG